MNAPPIKHAALVIVAAAALASCTSEKDDQAKRQPVRYEHFERYDPRPLQIHVLHVDLTHPGLEIVSLIADDPDGSGPAHSTMVDPMELASRNGIIAAINANAFAVLDGSKDEYEETYVEGRPTRIIGWSQDESGKVSNPQKGYFSFWVHDDVVKIYNLRKPKPADHAVAGFGRLIEEGVITERRTSPLHPRSAIGYDASGEKLTLVVVDGRQNGYSEGMTRMELADLMMEFGCVSAVNLDGGGSSILLLADESGALQVLNKPSDGERRPVPVMLGVRLSAQSER